MKLEFDYNINDRVEIIEIGRTGSVTQIQYDGVRPLYLVRYFDNGVPQSVLFYSEELRKVKAK